MHLRGFLLITLVLLLKPSSSETVLKPGVYLGYMPPCHTMDPKFLSFALDSSFLHRAMANLTTDEWNYFLELVKPLSPAYLRLGGTDADRFIFKKTQYILSEEDWVKINNFAINANFSLVFDLNVMLRKESGVWDPSNAIKLLKFTKTHGFKVHFQLGNEPNSFKHIFNFSISPEQLGLDFKSLKRILSADDYFQNSLLIGPDVTRPKNLEQPSLQYLREFLNASIQVLDAVSWHQYYLNGRKATVNDFLDFNVMNIFQEQIQAVTKQVRLFSSNIPIWLSETGSAYGGGAPELSDRFASLFLFVDKLGLSSKLGLSVIMRQSLYQGHYSLIDNAFRPNPDYWVALLYKQIIGYKVFSCYNFLPNLPQQIRAYAYSSQESLKCTKNPKMNSSLIILAMNLNGTAVNIDFPANYYKCASYIFLGPDLQSSDVYLNGVKLNWDKVKPKSFAQDFASITDSRQLPGYSIAFWVFSESKKNFKQ